MAPYPKETRRMKSKTRLLSAIVLLPILVAGVYWLPTEWFTALLALAAIATQVEFYRMFRLGNILTFTGAALGLLIMAAHFKGMFLEASALSIMVITVVSLFRRAAPQGAIFYIGTAFFGLMYIPGLLGFQAQLHEIGPGYVLFVFAAVWGGDAAAYYLGGTFGKRKLYPAISPNKTWVGVGGSLAGGLAAGIAIKLILLPKLSLEAAAVTGLALGAIAFLITQMVR